MTKLDYYLHQLKWLFTNGILYSIEGQVAQALLHLRLYFITDIGIRNYVLMFKNMDGLEKHKNLGGVLCMPVRFNA